MTVPVTVEGIQLVVDQIVALYRPETVILFGSQSNATATEHSDADLLVVLQTSERPIRVAADIAAAIDHPFPLDIVVRTPEQVATAIAKGDGFLHNIIRRGVVLYEAGN
jgi:predicted nucleotidyltransferase